jgi:voltage-gated potassium channel
LPFFVAYSLKLLKKTLKQYLVYPKIVGLMILVLLGAGYLVYYFERGQSDYFHSWWDGIYFSVITSATVGYGDKYPVTLAGQAVVVVLILIGGSLLAVLIANIGGSFALRVSRRERGFVHAHHLRNHIIVCNWNNQVKAAIRDYRKAHHNVSFVLIDHAVETNPIEEYDVHFIRGSFTEDETLMKANVQHAKTVLIFGDRRIDEHTADAKAMKAVLAIKYLNPKAHTIVECLSGDTRSLRRVGADEVINIGEINSRLLVQTTLSQHITHVLQELLADGHGNDFFEATVADRYAGKHFGDIAVELRHKGATLIALGGENTVVNPDPTTVVNKGSTLIYIAAKEIAM